MQTKPRRLGKGLSSLLGEAVQVSAAIQQPQPATPPAAPTNTREIISLGLDSLVPGRFQPRRHFDDASLAALSESIKSAGVMQPVLVRPLGAAVGGEPRFELIAGERRWRACRLAGITSIPAVIVQLSDVDAAQWALIENLQREDLGPIERAQALAALARDFRLTHAQIAERVGLDRSTVTNLIRLTELEPEVQSLLEAGRITAGHGRALLAAPAGSTRVSIAQKCALEGWTVRRLEQLSLSAAAADAAGGMPTLPVPTADQVINEQARSLAIREMERRLQEHLGSKVTIKTDRTGRRGRVVLRFYGLDQFEGMLARMGLNPQA